MTAIAMTREQVVRALIAKWQVRLGLQAWEIRFLDVPEPKHDGEPEPERHNPATEHDAVVYRDPLEQVAQIYLSPDAPDEYLETLVIHELLHLVVLDLTETAMAAAGALGGPGATVLMDQIDNGFELAVNRISSAITGVKPIFGSRIKAYHLTAWE